MPAGMHTLVKAIRDIGAGLFTAILILNRSSQLLGFFLLAVTLVPLTDALIVLKHGGTRGHGRHHPDHQWPSAFGLS